MLAKIDRRILKLLQDDGRVSWRERGIVDRRSSGRVCDERYSSLLTPTVGRRHLSRDLARARLHQSHTPVDAEASSLSD